jgi:hypothetical protein
MRCIRVATCLQQAGVPVVLCSNMGGLLHGVLPACHLLRAGWHASGGMQQ